jgi:putative ABC transport system substrate-binding protein
MQLNTDIRVLAGTVAVTIGACSRLGHQGFIMTVISELGVTEWTYDSQFKRCDRGERMILDLLLLLFVAALQVWPAPGSAQSSKAIPVIGVLTVTAGPSDPVATTFRDALEQFGYVDGQNIRIEHRNAGGRIDELPRLAQELVGLPADIIAVGAEPALSIVTKATTLIPIVIVSVDQDPVATGLVQSLSHPGGNVTGVFTLQSELAVKRLELLRETIPRIARVTLFWDPINRRGASEVEAVAQSMGLAVRSMKVGTPYDFDAAFRAAKREKADAVFVLFSPGFYIQRQRLANSALNARVPTMFAMEGHVEAGGLMFYGPTLENYWGRAAYYVDRILKGAKPSELPIEQVAHLNLAINLQTARALGIRFPESVLVRADQIFR